MGGVRNSVIGDSEGGGRSQLWARGWPVGMGARWGGTPAANAEWPLESSGSWSTFSGSWETFTRLEILKAWTFSVVKDMAKIKRGSCAVYLVQWEGYVTEGLLIL